jgi:hypothetical protein
MLWEILAPLKILENQKEVFRTTQDQESRNQGFCYKIIILIYFFDVIEVMVIHKTV